MMFLSNNHSVDCVLSGEYIYGEHIITQGDDGDEFFILIEGDCVVIQVSVY